MSETQIINNLIAEYGYIIIVPLIMIAIWTFAWKGYALWIASRENKKGWFIPILILNTFGILEIIYIYGFSQTGKKCIADWKNNRKKPAEVESSSSTEHTNEQKESTQISSEQ